MLFPNWLIESYKWQLISSVIDKVQDEGEGKDKGDPCDANKYLGVDFSFLGLFDELPEECESKKESTKISIVGPIEVRSTDGSTGNFNMGSNHQQNLYDLSQYGGNKAVICKKKSLKRCKRAYVSCKTVMGASRKYCRRSTKKSIAKYYANIRPKGKYTV